MLGCNPFELIGKSSSTHITMFLFLWFLNWIRIHKLLTSEYIHLIFYWKTNFQSAKSCQKQNKKKKLALPSSFEYFQDEKFIIPENFRGNLDPIHKSIVSHRTVYFFSFTKQDITFGSAFVRAAKPGLLCYYGALHGERGEVKGCLSGRMYIGQMGFFKKSEKLSGCYTTELM